MPRRARLEIPGIPLHITPRGVNRCAIFLDDDDRRHYLHLLREAAATSQVAVHAYVLMGNHIHLLASAQTAGAISRAMRMCGQCYVQAFNRRHGRTGTLWESRFKSCLVDSDRYLLAVHRYIELNPVRAAMATRAEAYRWSSVHAHLGRGRDGWLTPHPVFLAMGATSAERAIAYRHFLDEGTNEVDLRAIRAYLRQERALGDERFRAMVEKALNRPVELRSGGRPSRLTQAMDETNA
ncbi:MAG: transposase [Proteobacteria bacterium]|nr:transposase [Pseudomonadota bacterium]